MLTAAEFHDDKLGALHFASLDGELFIGVTRKPTREDEEDIRTLFAGTQTRTLPMRVHRNLLASYGSTFTEYR